MNSAQPPVLPTPAARRFSVFVKIASIVLLIAFLHIPLAMTSGVLREREGYRDLASREIAAVWGQRQLVTGPVLAVPYACRTKVTRAKWIDGRMLQVEETELVWALAYFLPVTLDAAGPVEPEVRHRGIYGTAVYSAQLSLTGAFQPDFTAAGIEAERIDWEKARVLFGVSDLHGVRAIGPFKTGEGKEATFESSGGTADEFLPLAAKVSGVTAGARLDFTFAVGLQGSVRLEIAPLGKTTSVHLQSPWPDPSFTGASLPVARTVSAGGFKAEWKTSHFSRGFAESWTSRVTSNGDMTKKIEAEAFGVRFAQPVDGYSMAGRAQKYGVLFFVLIFSAFFLFEVTSELRIHPLQYAMVGAALCLFFLGFLALTEFWPPGLAYSVAATGCTALVSLYSLSFLRTGWRTLVIGGGLGATYGYLFFVLQSQDYALVAGTVALFATLALVMFCTRRINWYALDQRVPAPNTSI
jgi:inner membrane protein